MFPNHYVVAAAVVMRLLGAIHQIPAGETAGGRAATAVSVVALVREKILNSNLGRLWHR